MESLKFCLTSAKSSQSTSDNSEDVAVYTASGALLHPSRQRAGVTTSILTLPTPPRKLNAVTDMMSGSEADKDVA